MSHFETDPVARFETVAVHSEIVEDRFGTEGDHSEKAAVRFGTAEDRVGMEGGHSEIVEAGHSEIEIGSRVHFVVGTAEAAQTLALEVDQNQAVVGEMGIVVADKAVVAERKVEEKQNRTNFGECLQTVFVAAVAEEDSRASQPSGDFLVHINCTGFWNDSHNCQDSDLSLDYDCLALSH